MIILFCWVFILIWRFDFVVSHDFPFFFFQLKYCRSKEYNCSNLKERREILPQGYYLDVRIESKTCKIVVLTSGLSFSLRFRHEFPIYILQILILPPTGSSFPSKLLLALFRVLVRSIKPNKWMEGVNQNEYPRDKFDYEYWIEEKAGCKRRRGAYIIRMKIVPRSGRRKWVLDDKIFYHKDSRSFDSGVATVREWTSAPDLPKQCRPADKFELNLFQRITKTNIFSKLSRRTAVAAFVNCRAQLLRI